MQSHKEYFLGFYLNLAVNAQCFEKNLTLCSVDKQTITARKTYFTVNFGNVFCPFIFVVSGVRLINYQ